MFQYCKLQFCCLIVLVILGFIYDLETKRRGKGNVKCNPVFDAMLLVGDFEILFDGITAWTVNHLDTVPLWLNGVFHILFFITLDVEILLYFIYMLRETDAYPKKNILQKILIYFPFAAAIICVLAFMPQLEYVQGKFSNYSYGLSVIACFSMVGVYLLFTVGLIIHRWRYISKLKIANIFMFLGVVIVFTGLQMVYKEALLTSGAVLLFIFGIYLTQENPLYRELSDANKEMVMGFATLVENKDDTTGGHIRRTSAYVEILARGLRERGIYSEELTEDFITNLHLAAPMHDIGKIAIPDSILQAPRRLTTEEFEIMKTHSEKGGQIINQTFSQTGNVDFAKMAYKVAYYHHEKWNGNGYPSGIKEKEIPLCARIMAVADVFDAVTEKRCYKEALPISESFRIIEEGSGKDFDPEIVKVFLAEKAKIEKVHKEVCGHTENA